MIQFRCWYCNKGFAIAEDRVGTRVNCGCGHPLRVPAKSNGYCRIKTFTDRLVEAVVYGGGGALLGLGLALLILSQLPRVSAVLPIDGLPILLGLTGIGFLFGFLGGERGIELIGRAIRDRESK